MPQRFRDTRDFEYLSDVYVYIEQFGKKGHQIGRKIGDMLELLTMGYCYSIDSLKQCMQTEIALEGFTEAKHKVEFSFFKLDSDNHFILNSEGQVDQQNMIGFIECKKVGVEVTVHPLTRSHNLELGVNQTYAHTINPRWLNRELDFTLKCIRISTNKVKVHISSQNINTLNNSLQNNNSINEEFDIEKNKRFLITLVENGTVRIIKPANKLADISGKVRLCHVFTLNDISDKASFKIDTCLTGPQTIEKAKQSALVALDVRKKRLGKWGKEEINDTDNMTSILVIGEASHWEDKSVKVVKKTIDYNLVVPDPIIIMAFQKFIEVFGDNFLNYINKDEFKNNSQVRELILEVITSNGGAIFYDLSDLNYKKIKLLDDRIVISNL